MNELVQQLLELKDISLKILEACRSYAQKDLRDLENAWRDFHNEIARKEEKILKRGIYVAGAVKGTGIIQDVRKAFKHSEKMSKTINGPATILFKGGTAAGNLNIKLPSSYRISGVGFWRGINDEYRILIDEATQLIVELAKSQEKSLKEQINTSLKVNTWFLTKFSIDFWLESIIRRFSESLTSNFDEECREFVRFHTLRKNFDLKLLRIAEREIPVIKKIQIYGS